jgi:sugar/nucleoside kinase (ribokinase family)
LVGHFTKDLIEDKKFQIGGTVFYSGILAKKFGFNVEILTSFGKDLEKVILKHKFLKKIKIFALKSKNSTTFKNVYFKNKRKQYVFEIARKISSRNLSKNIFAEILHLGPVMNEVDPKIAKKIKANFLGATLQGWLRKKNKNSSVSFCLWKGYKKYLPIFDVAICSKEDLRGNLSLAKEFAKHSKLFVLTTGEKGCLIFEKSKITQIFPKKVLKEGYFTGAGDVFACAFFTKFYQTKNPYLSGEFANEIARLHIEKGIYLNFSTVNL